VSVISKLRFLALDKLRNEGLKAESANPDAEGDPTSERREQDDFYAQAIDLVRLSELIHRLGRTGLTINPVFKTGISFGGDSVSFVGGWEISYETSNGPLTDTGQSIREAADAALANREAWK
jgi:hypothetical protein